MNELLKANDAYTTAEKIVVEKYIYYASLIPSLEEGEKNRKFDVKVWKESSLIKVAKPGEVIRCEKTSGDQLIAKRTARKRFYRYDIEPLMAKLYRVKLRQEAQKHCANASDEHFQQKVGVFEISEEAFDEQVRGEENERYYNWLENSENCKAEFIRVKFYTGEDDNDRYDGERAAYERAYNQFANRITPEPLPDYVYPELSVGDYLDEFNYTTHFEITRTGQIATREQILDWCKGHSFLSTFSRSIYYLEEFVPYVPERDEIVVGTQDYES